MFSWFKKYNTSEELRIRFLVIYGLFSGIALGLYAFINVIVGDYPFAIFETILAIIAFSIVYLVIKTNNSKWGRYLGFIPILAISITNFTFGGFSNTGIYWTYLLPLIVIYPELGLVAYLLEYILQ